ncbi:MAG: hypothetical protein ABIQ56_03180, partial [Chitinophagaceae bacterium]
MAYFTPVIKMITSVGDFILLDDIIADIIIWNDDDRTSGNPFIWDAGLFPSDENFGTIYQGSNTIYGAWKMMYEGPISVKWFGAKADASDDQPEIQAAIDYGASIQSEVYLPLGIYYVANPLRIIHGLKAFYGPGKLYFSGTAGYLTGFGVIDFEGGTTPVSNCRLSISEIDANHTANFCIYFEGGNFDNIVHDIVCINIPETYVGIQLNFECHNNIIAYNEIYLFEDASALTSTAGINVIGDNGTSDDGYYFENEGVPDEPTIPTYNNMIINNFISGGSHGIQLIGALRNIISGNSCIDQSARSIILGQACFNNFIEYNMCFFFGSSGVNLAFNCHHNIISDNYLYSPFAAVVIENNISP